MKHHNHYCCSNCGTEWSWLWSCACDDRCPTCRVSCEPEATYATLPIVGDLVSGGASESLIFVAAAAIVRNRLEAKYRDRFDALGGEPHTLFDKVLQFLVEKKEIERTQRPSIYRLYRLLSQAIHTGEI